MNFTTRMYIFTLIIVIASMLTTTWTAKHRKASIQEVTKESAGKTHFKIHHRRIASNKATVMHPRSLKDHTHKHSPGKSTESWLAQKILNSNCKVQRPKHCSTKPHRGRAIVDDSFKWPRAKVPYEIFNLTKEMTKTLSAAMKDIEHSSCVEFLKKTNHKDYVLFTQGADPHSCASHLGRWGGVQEVVLGKNCGVRKGKVLHELMHTLGFEHEHNRVDRDKFVRIHWENIIDDAEDQFHINNGSCGTIPTIALTDYSYSSIMHYRENGFSKNGRTTIEPLKHVDRSMITIGQREHLDNIDVERINIYYNCEGRTADDSYKANEENVLECHTKKGPVQSGKKFRSKHYVYRCNSSQVIPIACSNSSRYEAVNDETFRVGSLLFRCAIHGLHASRVPVACIADSGETVQPNEPLLHKNQMHICVLHHNNSLHFKLVPPDQQRCFPAPGESLRHNEEAIVGDYVERCAIKPVSGFWKLVRVACIDNQFRAVQPGNNFSHSGLFYHCTQHRKRSNDSEKYNTVYRKAISCADDQDSEIKIDNSLC